MLRCVGALRGGWPQDLSSLDTATDAERAERQRLTEKQHQCARVIQDAWRKHQQARRAEQARLELEQRREGLVRRLQDVYAARPAFQ